MLYLLSVESFTILNSAATKFQVKIKEAMYINWEKPALNQQIYVILSLSSFISLHVFFLHLLFVFHSTYFICVM